MNRVDTMNARAWAGIFVRALRPLWWLLTARERFLIWYDRQITLYHESDFLTWVRFPERADHESGGLP